MPPDAIRSSTKLDLPNPAIQFPIRSPVRAWALSKLVASYFEGRASHGSGGQPKSTPTERALQEKGASRHNHVLGFGKSLFLL
jgi:hypothetical protein